MEFSSLHTIAKIYVANGHGEEGDRDCYPKNVLHGVLQNPVAFCECLQQKSYLNYAARLVLIPAV
jgi:hypothetical protein